MYFTENLFQSNVRVEIGCGIFLLLIFCTPIILCGNQTQFLLNVWRLLKWKAVGKVAQANMTHLCQVILTTPCCHGDKTCLSWMSTFPPPLTSSVFTIPWEVVIRCCVRNNFDLNCHAMPRHEISKSQHWITAEYDLIPALPSFLFSLTSKIWSPGASLPSLAAIESRTISCRTMFPSGVSFPPTIRRPSSSPGSSLISSTTVASATKLDRSELLSVGEGKRKATVINMAVCAVYSQFSPLFHWNEPCKIPNAGTPAERRKQTNIIIQVWAVWSPAWLWLIMFLFFVFYLCKLFLSSKYGNSPTS